MKFYERLDHTADIGIKLCAPNLKMLFKKAAAATFNEMAKPIKTAAQAPSKKFSITLRAETIDELLWRWLGELVSLSDAKRIVFTGFEILELSDTGLKAIASAKSRKYFEMIVDIKAVTYHALHIEKSKAGLTAQVIFDV